MRAIFVAMLMAIGIGLFATSNSFAAPTAGSALAIINAAEQGSSIVDVRWRCVRHHHRHSWWHRRCWHW